MTPSVSVVVPVYNGVAYVDATIRSILAQTFTDFELLVSDHTSTDGTWEALQKYTADPRVRLSRLARGGGAPANHNAVIELAGGEFIKLVHHDDLLYSDSLAVQVAALREHPSAALAASTMDVIDAVGRIVLRNRGLAGLRGEVAGTQAIRRTVLAGTNIFGAPACVLFRRAALADVGGWDTHFPCADLATCCAVLLLGNLVAMPRPLAAYRLNRSQFSVELLRNQPDHGVFDLRRALAATRPGLFGRHHLVIGSARAHVNVIGRRVVYRWLGPRLDPGTAAGTMPTT